MPLNDQEQPDANGYTRPSKSQLKRESLELQTLGQDLLELSAAKLAALNLPERLTDALRELRRTRSFEGKRRQLQYVGKLMREVDPEPLREAVAENRVPSARQVLALHEAETWRTRLIDSDNSLTEWLNTHPDVDVQALRTLIRNARREAAKAADAQPHDGAVERKGRAYRDLFKHVKDTLAGDAASQASDADDTDVEDGDDE